MIIIAIPKSASTSVMVTLGKYLNMEAKQDFSFVSNSPPEFCKTLHKLHSDIRELSLKDVNNLCDPNTINKQHVFPSPNNIQLFAKIKKVILLRATEDIVLAYRRGIISKNDKPDYLPGYNLEMGENEWLVKSKNDGLYEDLEFFTREWKKNAQKENTLFIEYQEYIQNSKGIINEIERFYNLPVTRNNVKAIKARYSRRSLISNSIFRLRKRITRIIYSFLNISSKRYKKEN